MHMTPATLVSMIEEAGVRIEWTQDVPRADYGSGLIRINPRLSDAATVVALAHEWGHHERGPSEGAADAFAAQLLIAPDAYAQAERLCAHDGAIARELGVTVALVRAYRERLVA